MLSILRFGFRRHDHLFIQMPEKLIGVSKCKNWAQHPVELKKIRK